MLVCVVDMFFVVGRKVWGNTYEVDALAKGVAVDRSFWRGDAKALREDATVVGDTRAVPEKTAVTAFSFCVRRLLETLVFTVALNAEDVLDLEIHGQRWEAGKGKQICTLNER